MSSVFYDIRSVVFSSAVTPIHAWNAITLKPRPLMSLAFRLRDSVVARFGARAICGSSGERRLHVREGDKLDFFLVEHCDPDMPVLTARE